AVRAIADLAKRSVPEAVNLAYNQQNITFGKEYIIPKPVDYRLITHVAPAVAKAAMETGVARDKIKDWDQYRAALRKRLGLDDSMMRAVSEKARSNPKRVVFAEADTYKILKAAQIVIEEGLARPILLGNRKKIRKSVEENALEIYDSPVIDPAEIPEDKVKVYAAMLYKKRQRRGMTEGEARKLIRSARNYLGAAMVELGEADALVSGLTKNYAETIRPALQLIGTAPGIRKVAGMYLLLTRKGPIFIADTTVNEDPLVDDIVDITLLIENAVRKVNVQPRIALLSYSNFGSHEGDVPRKMREAVARLHAEHPHLIVEGEMQANFATNAALLDDNFPFSTLAGEAANTLICPNLESGNIAYKLLQEVGGAEAVGPILLGMKKPVHILQLGSSVREIVNIVTIAVVDAQEKADLAK